MYFEIYTTERSRKDPRKAFRFPSDPPLPEECTGFRRKSAKKRKIRRICRERHYELNASAGKSRPKRSLSPGFRATKDRSAGYRCRYCHRRIPDKKLCIDHIYPIYRTKTGNDFWLRLLRIGCERCAHNLAPACRRCNTKSRNAGIWVLRAILGRYEAYWVRRGRFVLGLVFLLNSFS